MTQTLLYKGYQGTIDADIESNVLHGKILFINDLVTYEADTLPELKKEFEESVDDYLETCKEIGKEPDKPFSGSFNVRVGRDVHQKIARAAAIKGISINQFVLNSISTSLATDTDQKFSDFFIKTQEKLTSKSLTSSMAKANTIEKIELSYNNSWNEAMLDA